MSRPEITELRRQLASLVEQYGERQVAERIGCSRSTIARYLAALPVRRGSALLVEVFFTKNLRAVAS